MNIVSCARVGDQQLGVELSTNNRFESRWSADKVAEIEASETSKRGSVETEKEIREATSGVAEGMPQPMTQEPPKPKSREFKITRKQLEKYGYHSDCSGCDAVLNRNFPTPALGCVQE